MFEEKGRKCNMSLGVEARVKRAEYFVQEVLHRGSDRTTLVSSYCYICFRVALLELPVRSLMENNVIYPHLDKKKEYL